MTTLLFRLDPRVRPAFEAGYAGLPVPEVPVNVHRDPWVDAHRRGREAHEDRVLARIRGGDVIRSDAEYDIVSRAIGRAEGRKTPECADPKCWTRLGEVCVEWGGRMWHRYCVPVPAHVADNLLAVKVVR